MRISHGQLSAIGADPERVAAEMARPGGQVRRGGYDQAVRDAIYKFHKQREPSDSTGHDYLVRRLQRFKNPRRLRAALDDYNSYVAWFRTNPVAVADTRINVEIWLDDGDAISGQVSRLDITAEGYRAVLLGRPADGWHDELRMPILQLAVAETFDRPPDLVSVGVQNLDGAGLAASRYSHADISLAIAGARDALARLRDALHNIPGA